jgi:hypothetical protein
MTNVAITDPEKPTYKETTMSTTQDNKTQATTPRPTHVTAPDGKSELPVTLPDFPPPTSDPSGDSGPPTVE